METIVQTSKDESDGILKTVYPEIKDLGKQFMTLVSGILAFTVTFAEKIIDVAHATLTEKLLLFGSWGAFIASIGAIGVALWWNYNAAMYAMGGRSATAWKLVRFVYVLFLVAGFSFVAGLGLLVMAGILRLF